MKGCKIKRREKRVKADGEPSMSREEEVWRVVRSSREERSGGGGASSVGNRIY